MKKAGEELSKIACQPFMKPKLRNTITEIKKRSEQTIDNVTADKLISADYDVNAKEKSKTIIKTFEEFIEDNKNEIMALQIIYGKPYGKRYVTYEEIKQLAEAIRKPPYLLDTDALWNAYEQLQKSKVKKAGPRKLLTDIISLVRFATGQEQVLEPFAESVNEKFKGWLEKQERLGKKFTNEQIEWLVNIKDHISSSVSIGTDDFELSPFYENGGVVHAYQLFGNDLDNVMKELNEVLISV